MHARHGRRVVSVFRCIASAPCSVELDSNSRGSKLARPIPEARCRAFGSENRAPGNAQLWPIEGMFNKSTSQVKNQRQRGPSNDLISTLAW